MMFRRVLAAGVTAVIGGLGLMTTATPAHAAPNCDVPNPPPICNRGEPDPGGDPTGTALFDQQQGGYFTNQIGGLHVWGHATDPDGTVIVDITLDGAVVRTAPANQWSPTGHDVYSASVDLPVRVSTVCAVARNTGGGPAVQLGCYVVHGPIGRVESVSYTGWTVTLTGWVIDPDTSTPTSMRFINYNGATYATFDANLPRADLATAYPAYGGNHGFSITYTLPTGVCPLVVATNTGPGMDTSAYDNCIG